MIGYITHPQCIEHDMGGDHPESPARVREIDKKISAELTDFTRIEAPLATDEQLLRAHSQDYIDRFHSEAPESGFHPLAAEAIMNAHTHEAALRAAGAVIKAVDLVLGENYQCVFCNVRPPGHHCEKDTPMGFCFLGNVGIGALHALQDTRIQRIAIIDFDVHHGNGTEDIIQDHPEIALLSLFQEGIYATPETPTRDAIIHSPLPVGAKGDKLRALWEKTWLPFLEDFQPDLIFISAGFDAHENDLLGQLKFKSEDYGWITKQISEFAETHCQGRVISVLEGGYHIPSICESAVAHMEALGAVKKPEAEPVLSQFEGVRTRAQRRREQARANAKPQMNTPGMP